jgi:hypothetical protein
MQKGIYIVDDASLPGEWINKREGLYSEFARPALTVESSLPKHRRKNT